MEENIQSNSIDEIYVELLENINKIKTYCINNSISAIRIKRINDYAKTTYPELQKDFEKRFPKTYGMAGFKNNINILQKILSDVLSKNIEEQYYLSLQDKKVNIAILFTEVLLKFLSNELDLNETKNSIFLTSHEIEPYNFYKLNQSGILALCEMSENGVDITSFNKSGNLKLNFLNDMAKGNFKTKMNEALKKEQIIDSIERCLKEYSMEEIKYNDNFSLFFESEIDEVLIFSSKDMEKPIAIVNENGEFTKGSLNIVLITIYKNIDNKDEEIAKNANTIDNIINRYNELATEQTSNQPDLATALRMALGLGGENNTNNSNNSN